MSELIIDNKLNSIIISMLICYWLVIDDQMWWLFFW